MTKDNREVMQRAIGIIEGVSYGASTRVQDALMNAVEMLDLILNEED